MKKSGKSKSRARRLADGEIQVVVWIARDLAVKLAELEKGGPPRGARSRVIRQAILESWARLRLDGAIHQR